MIRNAFPLGVCLVAAGCASSTASSALPAVDTPELARAFVESFAQTYGLPPPPPAAPVTSLPEVGAVLRADDLPRYPEARAFADAAPGVEALAMRALLEITWAGSLRTVRDLLAEARVEMKADAEQLELRALPSDADRARLAELQQKIDDFGQVQKALDVLTKPHREAGVQLAEEALRRYPTHAQSHFAAAMSARLRRDWQDYGEQDRWLEAEGFDTSGVRYMRAMAEVERGRRAESARAQLEALTAEDPGLVRAQAQLVLLYDDIEDVHRELEQLRAVSPQHFLVRLAGPSIDAEWESSRSVR